MLKKIEAHAKNDFLIKKKTCITCEVPLWTVTISHVGE